MNVEQVLDRMFPTKLEGPVGMQELAAYRASIAAELPSGTSVEITTFMNAATVTIRLPGNEPINRTCIVSRGFK